jgi:hypothetical protein
MKAATESIKVSQKTLKKVRRHIKKSKQTIGGFYDLAAEKELYKQTIDANRNDSI